MVAAATHCLLLLFALAQVALSQNTTEPPCGTILVEHVQAKGVQKYTCNASSGSWTNVAAWASLYAASETSFQSSTRIGLHYFLPYPDSSGGKATWSHFASTGAGEVTTPARTVTAKVLAREPVSGTIDRLLLQTSSFTGDSDIAYIQRIPVSGGVSDGSCKKQGATSFVPYESNYTFWRA